MGLHHREGEAGAGDPGQAAEELELGVGGVAHLAVHAVWDDLEHAGAELAQDGRQRGQLGLVGERAGDLVAANRAVGEDARRRHAERADLHPRGAATSTIVATSSGVGIAATGARPIT